MADTGRPTDYSPEKLDIARRYLAECEAGSNRIPSISRLAYELSVSRDTVYEWEKDDDKQDFSDTVKKVRALQEADLIENGLRSKYNPAMSIFLLKANAGMVETSRQELTGKDGKDLPTPILTGVVDVSSDHSNEEAA